MPTPISMSYVSPAVVVKRKTETRRHWTAEYARRFKKGDVIDAYSHTQRYGGVKIATIRLTATPYRENMSVHNTEEKFMRVYEAEGFAYMDEPEEGLPLIDLLAKWIELGEELWVVPFEIISVEEGMVEKFCTKTKLKQKRDKLIDALLGEDMRDDLMTPPKPREEAQKSVQDAVMEQVVKNTMAQVLPKCEWCGKDTAKTFQFKADKKKFHNICSECNKLPEEGRWGEIAEYLKHIPKGEGKRIDEEEGTKKIDPPAILPVVTPTPAPPTVKTPTAKPTPEPKEAPTERILSTSQKREKAMLLEMVAETNPKQAEELMEGFWTCNGCGSIVADDMACSYCHYTKEKSMKEIRETQMEEANRLKEMKELKAQLQKKDGKKAQEVEEEPAEDEEEEIETCPNCGGEVEDSLCKGCGASIVSDDELEEGQVVCTVCSCVLEADEIQCPECGKSRVEIEKEQEEESEDA